LFEEFGASPRVIERAWQLYQELRSEGYGRDRFRSRFARAGESGDCGHERRGGEFTIGNTCAVEGGAREIPRGRRAIRVTEEGLPREYRGKLTSKDLAELRTGDSYWRFRTLADAAVRGESGYLPTVEELKVLAKIGETTRGQYEYGGRFVEAALGKEAARVWAAAN